MILFALFGVVVGSFLNVCIDRLPDKLSLLRPASHCPACQHRLALKDLIPIFSYLWLKGACRYCQASINSRILWIELGTGIVFALLWWRFDLTPELAIMGFYFCVLIVILTIDLERGLILNKVVYPATAITLITVALVPNFSIANAAAGMGLGLGIMLLLSLFYRGGMGCGDVKMGGLVGAMVGFPGILTALFIAVVVGGLVSGVLVALAVKRPKETIAFGPFLSLGTMVALVWGNYLVTWYMGFL